MWPGGQGPTLRPQTTSHIPVSANEAVCTVELWVLGNYCFGIIIFTCECERINLLCHQSDVNITRVTSVGCWCTWIQLLFSPSLWFIFFPFGGDKVTAFHRCATLITALTQITYNMNALQCSIGIILNVDGSLSSLYTKHWAVKIYQDMSFFFLWTCHGACVKTLLTQCYHRFQSLCKWTNSLVTRWCIWCEFLWLSCKEKKKKVMKWPFSPVKILTST